MATNIQAAAFLFFLAAAVLRTTHATTYNVGNTTGWQTPTSNANFYSTWASQYTFSVGDSLVFNFQTGVHDVAIVSSQSDFTSCNSANALSVDRTGPVTILLNTTGTHYYFCTFSNHCSQGQKLAVTVGGSGPSGSPGSTLSPPPPPSSGASSLVATFSIFLMSIAIYLQMW